MVAAVSDTHAVIWYLYKDNRLSPAALSVFDKAHQENRKIGISAMTFVEIIYLVEKQRIPASAFGDIVKALDKSDSILEEIALNREIARVMRKIPRTSIPDMPDRIIAATALHLNVPLISRDAKIQVSKVKTIW